MKVLFSGGGTMGSVSPLMAIYEELKSRDKDLAVLWLGTKLGPEKNLLAKYQISFQPIVCGKWRQYFSLANLLTPFAVLIGIIQSFFILRKFKPDIVLTAGSFVAVPVFYAAWLLGIPRLMHQQDLQVGLANKLMKNKATKVTVTFPESIEFYGQEKTIVTSNPVRKEIFSGSKENGLKRFNLKSELKTILILGGGTGAQTINQLVLESLPELIKKYQIIHLSGQGKSISGQFPEVFDANTLNLVNERYREYEFLTDEIFDAYALADLVICRSGFSTLSELAVLAKPALVIPIPGHQEINALYFAKNNAVKILSQENLESKTFVQEIDNLLSNNAEMETLSRNISKMIDKKAARKYGDLVGEIVRNKGE